MTNQFFKSRTRIGSSWLLRTVAKSVVVGTMALFATASQAAIVSFDFTSLGSNNTFLGVTETVNGIKAYGFNNNLNNPSHLWLRDQTNDHGLGVCSEGQSACQSGGGNVNELDNNGSREIIVLENTNGGSWNQLWLSSLDNSETGRMYWANSLNSFSIQNIFNYAAGTGPFVNTVEANLLSGALPNTFDPTAKFLAFIAGPNGSDNDHLIWKGSVYVPETRVPEPAPLAFFGLGLVGLALSRRKKAA